MVESLSGKDSSIPATTLLTRELLVTPWVADFASQLYKHSPWTFTHSERVAQIVDGLGAKDMSLSEEDRLDLARAGLLHDVGKIYISPAILDKPSVDLTPGERVILDRHPRTGFDLIRPQDEDVASIIVSHHEFQQRKYPRVGERQDFDVKTRKLQSYVAVADELDAMLSPRPYKPAWTREEARTTLNLIFNSSLVDLAITTLPA